MGDSHVRAGEVVSRKLQVTVFLQEADSSSGRPEQFCCTSQIKLPLPARDLRNQTAARLWFPLQTLQTSICQTVFPTTVFSPIQMDAATITVISGNLVMPKNRFPLRTLQTSHCQLFFQARQHLSVENSAVQD
jgi:hypothetical protein